MKKVFSPFILIVALPLKLLRKTHVDNFVGGIIFGALFALGVNIITIQLQEAIQKQRILEAVELEIIGHQLQVNNVVVENSQRLEDNSDPTYYYQIHEYNTRVWDNSEALKYIVQLDPNTQANLITYYGYIDSINNLLKQDDQLYRRYENFCFFDENGNFYVNPNSQCTSAFRILLNNEISSASDVHRNNTELQKHFHPTKDRLKNPILRFFMGDKAVKILSS